VLWGFKADVHQIKQGPQEAFGLRSGNSKSRRRVSAVPIARSVYSCEAPRRPHALAVHAWIASGSDPESDVAALAEGLEAPLRGAAFGGRLAEQRCHLTEALEEKP
jgi:hypothetical protein